VDRIIGGDMTAGLAYVTPAGGAVVTAVAPVGLRDLDRGTVGFTTSIGLPKKLERMLKDPRVALSYHAREHGLASEPGFVLVQGDASVTLDPDEDYLRNELSPRAERFMGPPREGLFWDRWLREYYADRVLVEVSVKRVLVWPDESCRGQPVVHGQPLPAEPAPPQQAPKGGPGPRVDAQQAAERAGKLPHALLAFRGADGYPLEVPVQVAGAGEGGLVLEAPSGLVPPGGRRAGLLAHRYGAKLVGLTARQFTGWLTADGGRVVYAPHTTQGFQAPNNKTLLLLANGLLAKRGLRKARQDGTLERLRGLAAAR
jgi:hypothetical protein